MKFASLKRLLTFADSPRGFSQPFDLRHIARNSPVNADIGSILVTLPAVPLHQDDESFISIFLEASDEGVDYFPVPDRRSNAVGTLIPGARGGIAEQLIGLAIPADAPRFVRVSYSAPRSVEIPNAECSLVLANKDYDSVLKSTEDIEKLNQEYEDRKAILEADAGTCNQFIQLKGRLTEAHREFNFIKNQVEVWPTTASLEITADILLSDISKLEKVGEQFAARAAIKENGPAIIQAIKAKTIDQATEALENFTEAHRATLKKHDLL